MFKIINENVEELEKMQNQAQAPNVEKVKLSEIKAEQKNEKFEDLLDALEDFLNLPAEDRKVVISDIIEDK